jgi:hypothetical protein
MKNLFLTSILVLISLISFSQKYTVFVKSYLVFTSSNVNEYNKNINDDAVKIKIDCNETFIIDFSKKKITNGINKYFNTYDITSIIEIRENNFLINYNEVSIYDTLYKTPTSIMLDLNGNKKIIQYYLNTETKLYFLKCSEKNNLVIF